MTAPILQNALNAGELSPSLFGRTDLDKYRKGCSTLRNFFASYRGGAASRAGTAFVGQCKQGSLGNNAALPPVLIPFQYSVTQGIALEFGDNYLRFAIDGAYVTETPIPIYGFNNVSPALISVNNLWAPGDWVYASGIGGIPEVNGRLFVIGTRSPIGVTLLDPLTGGNVDATNWPLWTGGGTLARIYEVSTPYAASDLPLLKWTQSADVMTLTHPSYPPYDLTRINYNNWTLTQTSFDVAIAAPTALFASASSVTTSTTSFYYQYVATAVDAVTGQESIASPPYTVASVNISAQAGTIRINCNPVTTAESYNFYRAPVSYASPPVGGQIYGYIGTSRGVCFTDANITPDYTVSPPIHTNPFATSSVTSINVTNPGSGYSTAGVTVSISSTNGSSFAGTVVVIDGQIQWVTIDNGGHGYSTSDTLSFIDSTGSGAQGTIQVGPSTGTYPGVCAYFQQRRFYASTYNNPDTYFASQPGAFTNMDRSIPTKADDAIVGTPWSQQVNGIQWMINMPGGLVVLTGRGAWQLSGSGQSGTAITPSNQFAAPQAYTGCSPTIRPIPVNFDILYVQEKGSIVRDLSYNFFTNIYTGTDLTVLSNHLFDGHTIVRWDWCEEPNKLLWAVRDDGILLNLTYLKEQDVYAWSRHDTNGLFKSVCSISEPPVDAAYFVVQRYIPGAGVNAYYLERMNDRLWETIDDAWCVDAGLSYTQNQPETYASVLSATGTPTLQQPVLAYGGQNYSDTTYARIDDPTGSGAIGTVTVTAGAITAVGVIGTLTGYTNPKFVVVDPTNQGGGAVVNIFSLNVTTFSTSAAVLSNTAGYGQAGDVIRIGGGLLTVLSYIDSSHLSVQVVRPITQTFPNDPNNLPIPQSPGTWSIATPITTVYGLNHLEGMTVSILADGVVQAPQVVSGGTVTLSVAASNIVVGLGFTAQLQTMYLDFPAQVTVQGRRKVAYNATVRVENSGSVFEVGTNQPDQSVQPGNATVTWLNMTQFAAPVGTNNPLQPYALFTGDIYNNINDGLGGTKGQIAVQQTQPLPLTVLAMVPWFDVGDSAG